MLAGLAEREDAALPFDSYGSGELIAGFERQIAELLGKEAAVFMPSGTMAQQIALRIWCERERRNVVAFHPLAHLEIHEQDGYHALHGLRSIHLGTTTRPMTVADVESVAEPVAALLIELPQRELGGLLPSWDELTAMVAAARERGMHVHMDGARLWETQPFYERSYAEIARLFDSVYVSFYKIIGGIAGAMLLGEKTFIDEARVWQRRHGGNLISLAPYVLAAKAGVEERLARIPRYVARAGEIADALCNIPGIDVVPERPPTNMMHLYLRGEMDRLLENARALAERDGIWAFDRLAPTANPNVQKWEFVAGDATLAIDVTTIVNAIESIVPRA